MRFASGIGVGRARVKSEPSALIECRYSKLKNLIFPQFLIGPLAANYL